MGRDLGGNKFDQGKAPLSMLPRVALEQEAQVMEFGAKKYGKFNYKKGMKWSRLLDAALRHVYAYSNGENNDPETGYSHLAHARCCLGFLLEYADNNLGEDDRLPNEKEILVADASKYNPSPGRYKAPGIPDLTDPRWANQSKYPSVESTHPTCPCEACQDIGDASGYCGDTRAIQRVKLSDPASGEHPTQSEASRSTIEAPIGWGNGTVTRRSGTSYGPYSEGPTSAGDFRIRLD